MAKLNVKIKKDNNEVKYISILRKITNESMQEIKQKIDNNDIVLSCNLLDIDELVEMKKKVSLLLNAHAKINMYEDKREVSNEFLNNLIESHFDTERYLEQIDEHTMRED
ncbi:hypothetical protein [Sporolactobacillus sp. THM19-2]|jgi:hypothetical protein|uniref:hypothetical protein n=1 Tax=Sporolactobacillus sp. THM19-2 TaxID=2511171 RepID=UPI00101EFB1A|nr:hypothetical protein [Sporolactobacillus sp. THM19-2]RYL87263.1 hypothetical protein EWH91_13140 [Sporolactobacillus sp. THM19-2]